MQKLSLHRDFLDNLSVEGCKRLFLSLFTIIVIPVFVCAFLNITLNNITSIQSLRKLKYSSLRSSLMPRTLINTCVCGYRHLGWSFPKPETLFTSVGENAKIKVHLKKCPRTCLKDVCREQRLCFLLSSHSSKSSTLPPASGSSSSTRSCWKALAVTNFCIRSRAELRVHMENTDRTPEQFSW